MLDFSLYYVYLFEYFRVHGCSGISNLGTNAVYDTTLGTGAGWGARTGDCGVNYDGDLG